MDETNEHKKPVYQDDTVKVYNCGCRVSKLESPAGKDYFCKLHITEAEKATAIK